MSEIDVSQWGEFRVGDLFDYERGKEGAPNQVPDGDIPLISETSDDNGFARNVQSAHVFPANTITVSVNYAQTVFVQSKPYCASVNIIVLLPTWEMVTHNSLLFLASIISSYNSRYDYQDKVSKARLLNSKIKLPITSDGNPDWEYMDNYIAELAVRAHKDVSSFNQVNPKPHKINIDNWKTFKVGDLFERVLLSFHGNGIRKDYISEVQDDTHQLPLLGAKKGNNGIVYYGDSTVFDSIDKCIGIVQNGAASAGLVYPEYDSFGVYTDAYAIKLKNGSELTNESILFVSAVLQKLLFSKYSYYNKCTWSKVQFDILQLPVDDDGQPNWQYMTKYIEMIQVSAKCSLQSYHKVDKLDK